MKKLISVFVCTIIALLLVTVNVGAAGNISNTNESITVPASGTAYSTTARPKYDTTSAYQKCTSAGLPYCSYVYGLKSNNTKYDASKGNIYTFKSGDVKYMLNWVRENYNSSPNTYTNYAGMAVYNSGTGGYNSHGIKIAWSPDSV